MPALALIASAGVGDVDGFLANSTCRSHGHGGLVCHPSSCERAEEEVTWRCSCLYVVASAASARYELGLAARNRRASTGCPYGLPLVDQSNDGDRRLPGFSCFVDARRYVVKIALLPPTFFESAGQDGPGRH